MPRAARPPKTIDSEKQRILNVAAEIIRTHGFDALSMRRLAREVGMTAANLYNYVSGKDQIYLEIQHKGFNLLKSIVKRATDTPGTPNEKVRASAMAYIQFALANPDLYKVMFAVDTPKYADYRGTETEDIALAEKNAGLAVLDAAREAVRHTDPTQTEETLNNKVLFLWSTLHGIANLLLSRILQEVTDDTESYIAYAVDRLVE